MLQSLPYFRALLRAVEADFYGEFELASPVLDLGCGDGQFASQVFKKQIDVGIDPALGSLREAKGQTPSPALPLEKGKGETHTEVYQGLVQAFGSQIPFADGYFASAFSNSVLEHITDLQPVLSETGRVMKKGALFLFCVPNHRWQENLSISGFLRRIGLKGLANAYVRLFTRISRHVNMLSPEDWEKRLNEAGFQMERYWHYFPPAALHALEWGHYFGLPSWVARALTGRWVLAPGTWNLGFTERAIRKHAEGGVDEEGTYTWYVARRK
ncbi:MAG: class I SAM-dependent methyltransferase [Chloroflexi bacterium]|nr:class I SAM-dependent methyltransferase [Chloroflexota bacterium]